jgi:hypothetical protein
MYRTIAALFLMLAACEPVGPEPWCHETLRTAECPRGYTATCRGGFDDAGRTTPDWRGPRCEDGVPVCSMDTPHCLRRPGVELGDAGM